MDVTGGLAVAAAEAITLPLPLPPLPEMELFLLTTIISGQPKVALSAQTEAEVAGRRRRDHLEGREDLASATPLTRLMPRLTTVLDHLEKWAETEVEEAEATASSVLPLPPATSSSAAEAEVV